MEATSSKKIALSDATHFRLHLLLARHVDGIGYQKSADPISRLEAVFLTVLEFAEHQPGSRLNQQQIAELLNIGDAQLSNIKKDLLERKFCEAIHFARNTRSPDSEAIRGKFYRITTMGLSALARFGELYFRYPEKITENLDRDSDFKTLIRRLSGCVEEDLKEKFQRVLNENDGKKKRTRPTLPDS